MAKSLVPISVIVRDLAMGIGDSVGNTLPQFLTHINSFLREVNIYLSMDISVKSEILPIDSVIEMPCDFIYETKVGIVRDDKIAVLSLGKQYHGAKSYNKQTEILSELNETLSGFNTGLCFDFNNCFRGEVSYGVLAGYGRNFNNAGFYNINKQTGTIEIGSLFPEDSEIIIEYKSDGTKDGFKMIPTEWVMAAKRFCMSEYNRYKNPSLSQMDRQAYEQEYNKIKRLYAHKKFDVLVSLFQDYQSNAL